METPKETTFCLNNNQLLYLYSLYLIYDVSCITELIWLIEENGQNFLWSFEIKDDSLTITANIFDAKKIQTYQIQINLTDWKKIHYIFSGFQNLQKMKEFLVKTLNKKDVKINLLENKLVLEINIEILYENQKISIELLQKELNKDELIFQLLAIINNMQNVKTTKNLDLMKELEKQKVEILNLNKKLEKYNVIINELKEKYEILEQSNLYGSCIIRNIEEINMIKKAIKERLGKDVKYFKRLYKASYDGEEASVFHKLCDNIENTISFAKTGGYRRFGGFTTQTWNQVSSYTKTDKHAFVFSLDKLKIYPYTNNGRAIRCDNNYHPTFGVGDCDFRLCGKPLTSKTLYTHQTSGDRSYNYSGDGNALSEDGNGNYISTLEIEVYQAIL